MDINKLYEELGRADAAASQSKRDWEAFVKTHSVERRAMDSRHNEARSAHREAHESLGDRIKVLREAVALAEDGMDPLLAKLKATGEDQESEDLELWDDDIMDECCDEDEDEGDEDVIEL